MTDDMPPDPSPPSHIIQQPRFVKYRKYTLETDLFPIVSGRAEIPNFKPIEHWQALAASMGYGRTIEHYAETSGKSSYSRRCQARLNGDKGDAIFHMNIGQGGGFTGEGVVVMRHGWNPGPQSIVAGRFAICEHTKVEGPGANHQRGWHPGWCSKCGLDMSVDSGD